VPLDDLVVGHRRFRAGFATRERDLLARLAYDGQRPTALFITCSDSRVIPELMTDARPGELFVVRNVANRVPPTDDHDASVGAAVEFAVEALGVEEIVVCGHTGCGGVGAALDGLAGIAPDSDLAKWLAPVVGIVEAARLLVDDPSELASRAVEANVLAGRASLLSYPVVVAAVRNGSLRVHAWVYDLATGALRASAAGSKDFAPISG
jgi:carbonic anhydrase